MIAKSIVTAAIVFITLTGGAFAQDSLTQTLMEVEALKSELQEKMAELDRKMKTLDREMNRLDRRLDEPAPRRIPSDQFDEIDDLDGAPEAAFPGENRWEFGTEWTMLRPFGADRSAAVDDADANSYGGRRVLEYDNLEAGVRMWTEYGLDEDTGLRVRWWTMQAEAGEDRSYIDDQLVSGESSKMDIHTLDFEVTNEMDVSRNWDIVTAAGLRYANFDNRARMSQTDDTTAPPDTNFQQTMKYHGLGPTVAIEVKRELDGTPMSIFSNIRGSLLFGNAEEKVYFGDDTFDQAAYDDKNGAILPIVELQLGTEYRRHLNRDRELFLRAALEAQAWIGAGNLSSNITEFQNNDAFSDGGRYLSPDESIGFLGFTLGGGITF